MSGGEGRLRMSKYQREVSPERAKVWREKSPKYHQIRKVPVLYYLSRNRLLEHPHFMEVPLSSTDGLYLRGYQTPTVSVTQTNKLLLLIFIFFSLFLFDFLQM
jgi:hypothetical protein